MRGRGRRAPVLILLPLLLLPGRSRAQEVRSELERLAKENAALYVKPLTTGLGVAMNQGSFHTGRVHGPLGVHVGVGVAAALVPDGDDVFRPVPPSSLTYRGVTFQNPYGPPGTVGTSPTVTGSGDGLVLQPQGELRSAILAAGENPADYALAMPEGFDIPAVPFAFVEGGLGLVLGTEVTFRVIPAVTITDEVGELSAFGFGVKHSLSQYIPLFPIDVVAHVEFQDVELGDFLSGSARSYGVLASKNLGPLTLYGAGSVESADVDVSYTVKNPGNDPALPPDGTKVAFTDTVESQARFTGGITLNILALKISGNYSLGEYNAAALKVLLSFR